MFNDAVGQDKELLVGGGVDEWLIAAALKERTQTKGQSYAMTANAEVEVIREEGAELNAEHASLGEHGAVGFLQGKEAGQKFGARTHDGFTAEGPHLRAADIEHIGQPVDVLQCHIRIAGRQAVAQSCAVQEQLHAVFMADPNSAAIIQQQTLEIQLRAQAAAAAIAAAAEQTSDTGGTN